MSRRILLGLVAGLGIAALPICLLADGNATTQPAKDDAPATQPSAEANVPATQPIIVNGKNGFTITTTKGMSVGPGQMKVIHSTITITSVGGGNFMIRSGANVNPPATQPADTSNPPTTQPSDNGG